LGAFLPLPAFLPGLAVAWATCALRAPARAFLFGFGWMPAAVDWALPFSSVIDVVILHGPLRVITAVTTRMPLIAKKSK